ncbi:hypothetical protein ACP3V3_16980 [Vibrio sp. PNB22_3_1]
MDNSIQEKYDITATDYDFFGCDNGPTITIETSKHKFYVQTANGVYNTSCGCWILTEHSDGDIDWDDYADAYGSDSDEVLSTIIELAEQEAAWLLKAKSLTAIRDNDENGEIEAKATKIAALVGGETDDYLILSNTLTNLDSIDISNTMIFLQITLNCSQSQSSDIVDLFV